jgi:hypothetical protein
MDSFEFTTDLIKNNTILDYTTYTNRAINAILADDLDQSKFIDMLNDFKSFEGLNDKFCINFTGSWLKYALDGKDDKDLMNNHKLIRNILGDNYSEYLMVGGAAHHQIDNKQYKTVNWYKYLNEDIIEDRSIARKYMIIKCKKQRSNNSWHDINIIIVRPKDLLDILTTSKCVTEYRKYFITLAEIRRSYQETYMPWVIEQYKTTKLTLEQKVDKQSNQLDKQSNQITELLANSRGLITTVNNNNVMITDLHDEVSILNFKLDNIFEYLLMFARMTIPTWIGSTVIKQQYDILMNNKDNHYAMKHLKVLYMVGFYVQLDEKIVKSKIIDDNEININIRGKMKIYSCCTNFADIGARIKFLYKKYSGDDNIMFMLKPTVITLISCEINLERIILENSTDIFPKLSIVKWNARCKCYDVDINTCRYDRAHAIFDTICDNAFNQRFQGYQQRIDKFNKISKNKVDKNIINYIDNIDYQFFTFTKPYCQQYISCYYDESIDTETDEFIEYKYKNSSKKHTKRNDLNLTLSNSTYALRKLGNLINTHSNIDHIKYMSDAGILTKNNLPTLKAIAKFENIDTSKLIEIHDSDDSDDE